MNRRNLFRGIGAFLASTFAWTGRVKSQQEVQAVRIGVINIVSDGNSPSPFPMPEVHQVSIPIKNFDPIEAEKYVYHVREIRERGGGGGSARPDAKGILTITRAKRPSSSWAPQYYYFSIRKEDDEKRYTFDLHNVPLADLVRSLEQSMRIRAKGYPLPPSASMFPPPDSSPPVSLRGENVTLREALDLLRQESGCDVIQVEDRLVIDWCG